VRRPGELNRGGGTEALIAHTRKCPRVDAAGDLAHTNPGLQGMNEGEHSAVGEEQLNSLGYRTPQTQAWNYEQETS